MDAEQETKQPTWWQRSWLFWSADDAGAHEEPAIERLYVEALEQETVSLTALLHPGIGVRR
jgi:hypothetical protein